MSIFEDTLDHYAINNELSDTNIYFKLIFTLITLIVNLLAQSYVVPIIIFIVSTIIIVSIAKISYKVYAAFMATPIGFGLISVIFMSFFFGVGPHIFELGIFGWGVTAAGFNLGVLLFARILGGVSCIGILVLTTPMNRIFSIADNLKIPKTITDIALLMYRFIFMFLDVTLQMYHAQKTRLGYYDYMNSFHCLGMLAGMVFIRTWDQGDISYNALKSRGYNGEINLLSETETIKDISIKNIILLIIFEAILVIGIIYFGNLTIL